MVKKETIELTKTDQMKIEPLHELKKNVRLDKDDYWWFKPLTYTNKR